MKYYSEKLDALFNTPEELQEAERVVHEAEEAAKKAEAEKKANRAARAKEVEEAFQLAVDAQKKARKLLADFNKDYGPFHTSVKDTGFFDLFGGFFNLF
jgi:predicted Co/Zn/Cd cation transporter (cation efflux family)